MSIPAKIALLIGKTEKSILSDYLERVGNNTLLQYRNAAHLQWGKKQGESLYVHILNGIFILDTLRALLNLSEVEVQTLFTAYTIHDINKFEGRVGSFNRLATRENIATEIERFNLDTFFPAWQDYLADIESLARGHGRSTQTSGELLLAKAAPRYRLGRERILALRYLMKAADTLDLSHTLAETYHKNAFLDDLNTYLVESGVAKQYEFVTHRLTESRGLLSNVIHNGIADYLHEKYGLVPLLYYPDGTAYLAERGRGFILAHDDHAEMARRAAAAVSSMTKGKFRDFIEPRPAGIKVDRKCLELGVPFAGRNSILREIYNIIQRKSMDAAALEIKARERAERDFAKNSAAFAESQPAVREALDSPANLLPLSETKLKQGELIRSYYIFLNEHFRKQFDDIWEHIYQLLDVPAEKRAFYSYFEPRYDRAYVLADDLMSEDEDLLALIADDGTAVMGESEDDDPNAALLQEYMAQYVIFSAASQLQVSFEGHLQQYIAAQHKQCINCSSAFPTDKWMAGDVRDDITVQVFSNRLRGGPGEPKKHICAICQLQFLLEKLNYPAVRGETLFYLHLLPYSFLTRPFIEALRDTFQTLIESETAITALNLDAPEAVQQWLEATEQKPSFRTQTKKGTPQPYGLYIPRYSETTGNLLIIPLNPAGDNDGDKFLFALWNALVIQRHFGVKVLLSKSPVAPLDKEDIGDLYVDTISLMAQGLLPTNNYRHFKPGAKQREDTDNLVALWEKARCLFRLRELTFTNADNMSRLVRALAAHPLMIFYEVDRLLVAKLGSDAGGLETWSYRQAFTPVTSLAYLHGGRFMKKLSEELEKVAKIAVQHRLQGSSFERSSVLYPFNEVMRKLGQAQSGTVADTAVLRAAAIQDIYDHLDRLATRGGYKMTKARGEACELFVDGWFTDILQNVYEGHIRKLIAEEKLLRSAFYFYVRQKQEEKKQAQSN
jgi:CRISPR-associated protein Csc3